DVFMPDVGGLDVIREFRRLDPETKVIALTAQGSLEVAMEAAIRKLPPGYRAAFILHDVEGYEHEEVAELLGCAVGTSKSQLHKARAKLRKILTQRS
ncbi:MAG: sigma-70 family RNA polymerase sigma factor, partial [Acidobacteriota bacterium]|nr:sigma-70 family RNA polymerase sigma factor [Acidobacteriota bacterium]